MITAPTAKQIFPLFLQEWQHMMDQECHRHEIWRTPFVQKLNDISNPTQRFELAAVWSLNMVDGSGWFPNYVMALAARFRVANHLTLDSVRHGLAENAWDELGSVGHTKRSHFWLAVRLSRLLGLDDKQIESISPLAEASAYIKLHFEQCSMGDMKKAMGMLCLIEEFTTPEFTSIRKAFLESCEEVLGVPSVTFAENGGAEYFDANIEDDERHRLAMPALVATWLECDGIDLSSQEQVLRGLQPYREGIQQSIAARQQFFEGIYRFVEEGGSYKDLVMTR
jgi:pyrroloquinoline quinone (PQQ) biosynthesis protein C